MVMTRAQQGQDIPVRVEVLRAFWLSFTDEALPGAVMDLAGPLAFELRSARKVKFVQADTPEKAGKRIERPVVVQYDALTQAVMALQDLVRELMGKNAKARA